MNVVSLFDGMSCGKVALDRAGVPVTSYYASEIDKATIRVSESNHPDIIRLGDVTAHYSWKLPSIDLLIGGSPCQGFSSHGSGLNFEDHRSKLFFEYVQIKNKLKPRWFLLENVGMKQEWQNIISEYMGCHPVAINSNQFSAQNRKRLYWTNIPILSYLDKGAQLKDILETDYDFDLYNKKGGKKRDNTKAGCLTGTAHAAGNHSEMDVIVKHGETITYNKSGRIEIFTNRNIRRYSVIECERLQTVPDGYTAGVSNSSRYTMLINGWTVDVIAHIFKGLHD